MQSINEDGLRNYLHEKKFCVGLVEMMVKSLYKFPIRYFVVDDSGSMSASDGHHLVDNKYVKF
jgi:hypothetical protein